MLEKDGRGPQLCLGAVAESLPPQCSGLPLVGWSWDAVADEQRAATTIWGEYHVAGTFDGKAFTVTRPPGPPQRTVDPPRAKTPCPEPSGGWQRPDPKATTRQHLERASAAAQREPDFAGLWIDDPNPPRGEEQDLTKIVLNVAFTGDLERHTAALRKHWGGALCVSQRVHSEAALLKAQVAAQNTVTELGLEWLGSGTDVIAGIVEIDVIAADATHQAKIDERHGEGLVVLRPRLRPIP